MDLFIMRHGPAEDVSSTGLDSDRALTPKGRERVRHVAEELGRLGHRPAAIVTSPLVRARETAELVREVMQLGGAPYAEDKALGMTGRSRELVARIAQAGARGQLVVGHEPELSELVMSLTGRRVHMDKAMVVGVRFVDVVALRAELGFVLDPKTLTLTGP